MKRTDEEDLLHQESATDILPAYLTSLSVLVVDPGAFFATNFLAAKGIVRLGGLLSIGLPLAVRGFFLLYLVLVVLVPLRSRFPLPFSNSSLTSPIPPSLTSRSPCRPSLCALTTLEPIDAATPQEWRAPQRHRR